MVTIAYRDLDFTFQNHVPSLIEFPAISSPSYISTMPRIASKPDESTRSPQFQDVVRDFREAQFSFSCDHGKQLRPLTHLLAICRQHFLRCIPTRYRKIHGSLNWLESHILPVGWRSPGQRYVLDAHHKLSRREVDKLIAVESKHILTSKKSYPAAGVQLWEKTSGEGPPKIQLAVRFANVSKYHWLTASRKTEYLFVTSRDWPADYENVAVSESAIAASAEPGNNTVLRNLKVQRGSDIENRGMTASCRSTAEQKDPTKPWTVTISFNAKDGMFSSTIEGLLILTGVVLSLDKNAFIRQSGLYGDLRRGRTYADEHFDFA